MIFIVWLNKNERVPGPIAESGVSISELETNISNEGGQAYTYNELYGNHIDHSGVLFSEKLNINENKSYWIFGDSIAQWLMVALTFIAVLLLRGTLRSTENMLDEARVTANAAVDAAKQADLSNRVAERMHQLSLDTRERELRAYLGVQVTAASNLAEGEKFFAKIVIKNSGKTPAYEVSVRAHLGLSVDFVEPFKLRFDGINFPSRGIVYPDGGAAASAGKRIHPEKSRF